MLRGRLLYMFGFGDVNMKFWDIDWVWWDWGHIWWLINLVCLYIKNAMYNSIVFILPNSRFQIFPLIENMEWLYIWGVVCCSYAIVRRSVGRSVGRGIWGWGILGDLGGSWGYLAVHFWHHAAHFRHHTAHFWHHATHFWHHVARPSKCLQHHQQRWCKILWAGVNLLL